MSWYNKEITFYIKEIDSYSEEMTVYIAEINKRFPPFRAAMNEMLLTPPSPSGERLSRSLSGD